MSDYEKPVVLASEGMAEGVFLASGGDDCYDTTARIHQWPETGRNDFRIQVDGKHDADHNSNAQQLVLTFDRAVNYESSAGSYVSGSGTNQITIGYAYWNNHTDNIGLGDVVVTTVDGGTELQITDAYIRDIGKQY